MVLQVFSLHRYCDICPAINGKPAVNAFRWFFHERVLDGKR